MAQAAGAALMTPTSLGLLLASFPPERRAQRGADLDRDRRTAAALGPLIGGVLVTISWRWIFIVNVPIGVVAILIGWWKLPRFRATTCRGRIPGRRCSSPAASAR